MVVEYQGQRWLLPTLSYGPPRTTLQLALQMSYPSFDDSIARGATTCWENIIGAATWTSLTHPIRRILFLRGGVGAWMYDHLRGITPTGAGYSSVWIAPQISHSYGPAAVNMSLQMLHGLVRSFWRRDNTTRGTPKMVARDARCCGWRLR